MLGYRRRLSDSSFRFAIEHPYAASALIFAGLAAYDWWVVRGIRREWSFAAHPVAALLLGIGGMTLLAIVTTAGLQRSSAGREGMAAAALLLWACVVLVAATLALVTTPYYGAWTEFALIAGKAAMLVVTAFIVTLTVASRVIAHRRGIE